MLRGCWRSYCVQTGRTNKLHIRALSKLCFAAMYFRSYKKLRAVEPSLVSLFYARHFTIFVLIGVLSMVLATLQAGVQIGLPGFIYALLGPLCFWHAQWFKRKYKDIDQ